MKTYTVVTLAALLGAGTMAMAASEETGTAMHSTGAMSAEAHIAQMEAHLKQMQAELDAISKIKDPAERRARYKKHLQNMTNMMDQMNEARPTMTAKEQQLHSKMLEKRLDLLQLILTQVVKMQAKFPKELRPQQDW
jgi:hypothetical protein